MRLRIEAEIDLTKTPPLEDADMRMADVARALSRFGFDKVKVSIVADEEIAHGD